MPREARPLSRQSVMLRLPHLPPPVLTAYLDVNPASPRNQGQRGYVAWLTSTGQVLSRQMSDRDRRLFRTQLRRVEDYLRTARPRARGLAVFAGPKVWEVIPLQVEVAEELHWGKLSLQQMLWILDEHRPRGVVVLDGAKARFFHLWLGVITEDKAASVDSEFPAGRKKKLIGSSHPGIFGAVGVARDLADKHLAAQRSRFDAYWRSVSCAGAKRTGLARSFLRGSARRSTPRLKRCQQTSARVSCLSGKPLPRFRPRR